MQICNLDIAPGSYSTYMAYRKHADTFPFYNMECGKFIAREKYYTKREGDSPYTYMMIATVDGCGEMEWKGRKCVLNPGCAVLIDCRIFQEYATLPGGNWTFYYVHFDGGSMSGYQRLLLETLTPVQLCAPEKVYQTIEYIYQSAKNGKGIISYAAQSNAVSSLLNEMLLSLTADKDKGTDFSRSDISDLAEYIRGNCTKQLHIDDFVEYTHLTQNHLIRTFKKLIGLSPYQYLHWCRVNQAQQLLRTTTLTIAKIADMVGYGDSVSFIRHFKAVNQVTPREYRELFSPAPAEIIEK